MGIEYECTVEEDFRVSSLLSSEVISLVRIAGP